MLCMKRLLSRAGMLTAVSLLSGCDLVVLHPFGAIATQQGHLIMISTFLMLLIVVPVLGLTFFFAWRYRASNLKATYTPEWDHSTALELVIWTAPLFIVIALGAVTWINTHTLDPYRALRRSDPGHLLPAGSHPLVVDVVALDWKWLFIYPEQGIATVNELAAPVDMPIEFRITSSSVMNSFFIPALAGQIYAMPGMQTELHAVINHAGQYEGFSANYSGAGFSDMHFKFHGMSRTDFDRWVERAHGGADALSRDAYLRLAQPSERDAVHRYSAVAPGLYDAILNQCVARSC